GDPLTLLAEGGAEQLDVASVASEGLLRSHGLGGAVRFHAPLVVAAREIQEPGTVLAEARLEVRGGDAGELADGPDTHALQLRSPSPRPTVGTRAAERGTPPRARGRR